MTALTHGETEQRSVQIVREHGAREQRQQARVQAAERQRHVVDKERIHGVVAGYPAAYHPAERVGQTGGGHQPHGPFLFHAHANCFFCRQNNIGTSVKTRPVRNLFRRDLCRVSQ